MSFVGLMQILTWIFTIYIMYKELLNEFSIKVLNIHYFRLSRTALKSSNTNKTGAGKGFTRFSNS
jgi:hypothetical protein